MNEHPAYEVVIGLEVHARLLTKSKLFCGDSNSFGDEPNIHVSPITLAHPGTLPTINRKAIEFAIKMGLACHCRIEKHNYFARKNYFYPDLPKGYQISQHTTPICTGGHVRILSGNIVKNIRLNRIHMEEDAGKSLHDADPENTCIDFNRAGTPLIEIVSEPDLRSGEEAYAYLTALRKLVRYLEISDGNMEQGGLRCDVNISVRKKGATGLGTKVEIKNLNSMRNVKRAIEFESHRLAEILEKQGTVSQQTRSFDASDGTTFAIRDKEDADDYRYFPEPDLAPFQLEDDFIEQVRRTIPVLQEDRVKKYTGALQLSVYDATALTEEKNFSDYFEQLVEAFPANASKAKAAANWMLGPVRSWLNEHDKEMEDFPVGPEQLCMLIGLVENGQLSFSAASAKIFPQMLEQPYKNPQQIASEQNLIQQSDASVLEPIIDEVLHKYADKIGEYKKGKKGLLSLFVGEVMKRSGGKADPSLTQSLLLEKLKS